MIAIKVIIQNTGADCAIAALAMALGVSYESVADALPQRRAALKGGLSAKQIRNTAARLDRVLRIQQFDEDDDRKRPPFGILYLLPLDKKAEGHAAVYSKGQVIDPKNGVVWTDLATYLAAEQYRVDCILTVI